MDYQLLKEDSTLWIYDLGCDYATLMSYYSFCHAGYFKAQPHHCYHLSDANKSDFFIVRPVWYPVVRFGTAQSVVWLCYGHNDRDSILGRGQRSLLFTTVSRPAVGPSQPPIQWVPTALSAGVRRWRGVNDSVGRTGSLFAYLKSGSSIFKCLCFLHSNSRTVINC
jgi:hypothetical protein